jgi:hypothetical protein
MKELPKKAALLCAIAVAASSVSGQSIRDGLEVYIPFDEGLGNVANDASGNDREVVPADDLFPGATINWSGGRFGGSAKFDYDYFVRSPFEYFGIGGDAPRTVSFWVKTGPDDNNRNGAGGALVGWGINATGERIHVKFHGAVDDEGVLRQYPRTENQGGNNLGNTLPLNDGVWHHFISVFDPDVDANEDGIFAAVGDFNHYVDGELETKAGGVGNPVNTNIDPDQGALPLAIGGAYFPTVTQARFSDSRIDDFRLYSRALSLDEIMALTRGEDVDGPPAVEITNKIEGEELISAETPIEFRVTPTGGATVSADAVSLLLNGVERAGESEITSTDGVLIGRFSGLKENVVYDGKIGATDSQGRQYSFEFSFDTISEDNFTVEAEDFDFGGGEFIDDPILCRFTTNDCYFDKVSEAGVDSNDSVDDNRPTDSNDDFDAFLANAYRYGPGGNRDEEVDTWLSGDRARSKFVDDEDDETVDFDVERVSTGEWLNYTRTFEAGTYQIILRARSRAAQGFELGQVEGGSVNGLGVITTGVTGTGYGFSYLRDDAGAVATVELAGRTTLRLTATDADQSIDLNYLMFVPFDPTTVVVVPPVPTQPPVVLPPIVLPPIPGQQPGSITGITRAADGSVSVEFTGSLQSADVVTGPFVPVAGATSPFAIDASSGATFYIAR